MIPVFRPSIRRREMDAVLSCLVSDKLTDGPVGRDFLRDLTAYLELDAGILLREFERAVGLALEVLELEPGSSVLVSPLTSVLVRQIIEDHGFQALIADVDPDSMTYDLEVVKELAAKNSCSAIYVDAPFGFLPDMDRLKELEIPMIEDITSAFGAYTGESRCGSYGEIVLLRMEAQDILTVAGGTAILSSRKKYSLRMKKLIEQWPSSRYLTDMNSSLGSAQLRDQEYFFLKRQEMYRLFINAIRKGRHTAPVQKGESEQVFHSFPVFVKGGIREIQSYARKKGVLTRQAFSDSIITHCEIQNGDFQGARQIYRRCLLFPLYPMLSKSEVEIINKVLSTLP